MGKKSMSVEVNNLIKVEVIPLEEGKIYTMEEWKRLKKYNDSIGNDTIYATNGSKKVSFSLASLHKSLTYYKVKTFSIAIEEGIKVIYNP